MSSRSKLELKNNYLVIRADTVRRIHIDEISVLLIENTGCAVTASLLETLWNKKVAIIFCDRKRNPGAQLIPYYNSHDCSARTLAQIKWDDEHKKQVWSAIVREKILNQARLLLSVGKKESSEILFGYANDIHAGDVTNREGHAAKVYFSSLFGSDFTRDDECFVNYALNYGYGILLSIVNREVVANGYITQLGIFHKNVYNQFNLSCDIMEPFRPLFDSAVIAFGPREGDLGHEDKLSILETLNKRVSIVTMGNTALNAIGIYVRSVLNSLDEQDLTKIRFCDYEF